MPAWERAFHTAADIARALLVGAETESCEPSPTETIAHFALEFKVGAGAHGTVRKARDTKRDRHVAVNVPRQSQLSSEEAEKFVREARAAAQGFLWPALPPKFDAPTQLKAVA